MSAAASALEVRVAKENPSKEQFHRIMAEAREKIHIAASFAEDGAPEAAAERAAKAIVHLEEAIRLFALASIARRAWFRERGIPVCGSRRPNVAKADLHNR